jgi:hypothetical protein
VADLLGMIADVPEALLWLEALLVRARCTSVDAWTLARVETMFVCEGRRARARC